MRMIFKKMIEKIVKGEVKGNWTQVCWFEFCKVMNAGDNYLSRLNPKIGFTKGVKE